MSFGPDPINGIGRACADDFAAALSKFSMLFSLQELFETWRTVSAMIINALKTVIVITSLPLSPFLIAECRAKIFINARSWFECSVSDSAEYIGIVIGPKSNDLF